MRTRKVLDIRAERWQGRPHANIFYAKADGTFAYRFIWGQRAYNRAKSAELVKGTPHPPWKNPCPRCNDKGYFLIGSDECRCPACNPGSFQQIPFS